MEVQAADKSIKKCSLFIHSRFKRLGVNKNFGRNSNNRGEKLLYFTGKTALCHNLQYGLKFSHNPKVVGSNPASATTKVLTIPVVEAFFFVRGQRPKGPEGIACDCIRWMVQVAWDGAAVEKIEQTSSAKILTGPRKRVLVQIQPTDIKLFTLPVIVLFPTPATKNPLKYPTSILYISLHN